MKRTAALLVVLLLASACGVNGLSFREDDRVKIVTPGTNDRVNLPLEVRWTVRDFDGYFAVFFDRSPMKPNQGLVSLVPEDDACRTAPGCPDRQWLADRGIFVTDTPSLAVETLEDRRRNNRTKDRHEVTIVLLDRNGRRVGESAFVREFIVDRPEREGS